MFCDEKLLDSALPEGVSWPSELHKAMAKAVLLQNPEIINEKLLQIGVTNILNIPQSKIENIHFEQLPDYGFNVEVKVTPIP